MKRRAVFLDRDGTLVHVRHYPSRPEDLVLYDGLVTWLARLKAAGYALVMITNQSGIARGLFTAGDLNRMHDSLQASLRASAQSSMVSISVRTIPKAPLRNTPSSARVENPARACCTQPLPISIWIWIAHGSWATFLTISRRVIERGAARFWSTWELSRRRPIHSAGPHTWPPQPSTRCN